MHEPWTREPDLERLRHVYNLQATNPVDALVELKHLASRGSIMSMTYVGEAYRSGIGTAKDLTQAAEWFQRAANEGYIVASYKLGKVCQELNQHSRASEAFALGAAGQHLPSIYIC